MRGRLGVVAHPLADDRKRYMLASGDAGPRMPADVHREVGLQPRHGRNRFQFVVDQAQRIAVLPQGVVGSPDDGQQPVGTLGRVFAGDLLHALLPLDEELLSGLAAAVGEDAVAEVLFPQMGHVDERHAARVERKEEHVPGEFQRRSGGEVEVLDASDGLERNGRLTVLSTPV